MFEFKRKPKKKGEPEGNTDPLMSLELDADTASVDEFLRETKDAVKQEYVKDRDREPARSSCGCW